jgi:hypothetical protein
MDLPDQLIALGGVLWEKEGISRIYFRNLHHFIGLQVTNIYSLRYREALYNGKPIPFPRAKRILFMLNRGKFWYNLTSKKFESQYLSPQFYTKIVRGIKQTIGEYA